MRSIQKEIVDNLSAIEQKHHVRILLAAESGSRAWGFASPDSDYDVRFIFVREEEEYLRLVVPKDVIEWQLDEVLDINGWDVKKALLAFARGNPNVMEWDNSPIIYRLTPEWQSMKATVRSYFSEKSALCHYYGTAKNTYLSSLTGEKVRYKKYFYALRPILCCRWIERYHQAPPVEFKQLLKLFSEQEEGLTPTLYDLILELLARKAETQEKTSHPQIPAIIDFIEKECRRLKAISDAAPDDHKHDYTALDVAFCRLLRI